MDTKLLPVLQAQRIDKTYANGLHALDDVRLDIQSGEFVSLLGPSGCGKSTLLRLFAGLEQASAGQLRWWGARTPPTGRDRSDQRALAMVFQEATLMPWATVAVNVRLPFDLAGTPADVAAARVEAALALVGLERFAGAYPRELSGGMQMRVSIARALVNEPDLLLMDEPFGALDEFTRHRLDSELRSLWARRPLTVVFVTHSIYEAVFLSTRVIVMGSRPGRIIADIPVEGPRERDAGFRVSPGFLNCCRLLEEKLGEAHESTLEELPR